MSSEFGRFGEEEREARILVRILAVLEEILERLPEPPQYRQTMGIVVSPNEVSSRESGP